MTTASRKVWKLSPEDYPAEGTLRERIRFALGFAIMAPSTHNTQPWRFKLHGRNIDLHRDEGRALPVIDHTGRQAVMSCGAALHNLRVALEAYGHPLRTTLFPDPQQPGWLARVEVGPAESRPRPDPRLEAMLRRRTNRQPFFSRPVGQDLSERLAKVVLDEHCWTMRMHPRGKQILAEIIGSADRVQLDDPAYRKELGEWLVPWGSRRLDGIPFAKKEYGTRAPLGLTMALRSPDLGTRVATRERVLALGSPLLLVLCSDADEPIDWLRTGASMQALLLEAELMGLSSSFLNQALEIPALRERVGNMLDRGVPQLILRLGFAEPDTRPTPRRPLEEVVEELS